jgi:adenosylcobinamide-GDP ribazoletransferase
MHDEASKVTDIRTRARRAPAPASVEPSAQPIATAPAGGPIGAEPITADPAATRRDPVATAAGLVVAAADEMSAALRLLTRLPIGPPAARAVDRNGAAAFPIVGALVGLIGMVPLVLAGVLEPLVASLLSLATVAVLTGALHLDGLADTADALLAPDRDRAERARKDPSVGPGGAISLILVLGVEASALAAIVSAVGVWVAAAALVAAEVLGRTTPILMSALARARVSPVGFGAWFAARVGPAQVVGSTVVAAALVGVAVVATASVAVGIGAATGLVVGLSAGGIIIAMRRQLDGDGMGAIVELTVAATLTAVALAT